MPEQPADHTATSPIHSSQHYVPSSSSREAKSACALIHPVLSEAEMHKSVSQDVRTSMNARIANSHPGIGIITNMAAPHTPELMHLELHSGASSFFMKSLSKKSA